MASRIDAATYHRIAPELANLWAAPAMIEHARAVGGEAMAWGVAWAMRAEAERIVSLLAHWRKDINGATPGQRLAFRVIACARAAQREWRSERWR